MTPFQIIERFHTYHSGLVADMRNADHNFSPEDLNPYHIEGDVWTHTMMVFNYAVAKSFPTEVLLAALLHDVGKAYTLNHREKSDGKTYVSFVGHDGVSYYRSLGILRKTYADILTEEQILTIAKLVANHSVLYAWQNSRGGQSKEEWIKTSFAGESDFLSLLSMLVEADSQGRIAETPSGVDDYREYRDFVTNQQTVLDTAAPNLTLLVGPPASGKSTWIRNNASDEVIISSDDIIMDIGEGDNYDEKWKNADFKEIERIMWSRFQDAVKSRKNIIVDRTNMSKKSRRRFIAAARKNYNVIAVLFATSHGEMVDRMAERKENENKSIPNHVLHNMEKSFSYPLLGEVDLVIEV